jgi:hypothetical protein
MAQLVLLVYKVPLEQMARLDQLDYKEKLD